MKLFQDNLRVETEIIFETINYFDIIIIYLQYVQLNHIHTYYNLNYLNKKLSTYKLNKCYKQLLQIINSSYTCNEK